MKQVTICEVLLIVNEYIKNVNLTLENLNDNLSEFGMSSIAYIQMIVALEEKFECEIPDSKLLFSEMNTVNKLLNVLQNLYEETKE